MRETVIGTDQPPSLLMQKEWSDTMKEKILAALMDGTFLKKAKNYIAKHVFGKTDAGKKQDSVFSRVGGFVKKAFHKFFGTLATEIARKTTPIDPNKIVVMTFRCEYECNAKWICEEIIKRGLPYKIVWGSHPKKKAAPFPPEITPVKRETFAFAKEMASARILIDNGISMVHMNYRKKPGQILMETWHGAIGIKKFSPQNVNNKRWVKNALKEASMTDYCISNSTFENDVYREDYWKESEILTYGHARNDILCEKDTPRKAAIRARIYEHFKLNPDARICMYAPTFRDDKDMRPYQLDYAEMREALEQRFGGEWVIMTRFHDRIRTLASKMVKLPKFVINCSTYTDIQELMTCVDVGITDYSSWICEFLLTGKPGFLFATDINDYTTTERAFFYPLDSMPYPLATDKRQLIENILTFDEDKFAVDVVNFLNDKGSIDDGHAAERIVDKIEELMEV